MMDDNSAFTDLICRVRAGDGEAAEELVRRYEPKIRRAIRAKLTDPKLRQTLDSMDVCQSVMLSFFVRANRGEYELETPEQLSKLLTTMARNKLLNQARERHADRRDNRREASLGELDFEGNAPDPAQLAEDRDLLDAVRRKLDPDVWKIADLQFQGHSWDEISEKMGMSRQTARSKLYRALRELREVSDE